MACLSCVVGVRQGSQKLSPSIGDNRTIYREYGDDDDVDDKDDDEDVDDDEDDDDDDDGEVDDDDDDANDDMTHDFY